MAETLSPVDTAKLACARRASEFVEDGMKVGLGTGSTAAWLVKCLGERVRNEGLRMSGVPTSNRTAELAREVGIDVISLAEARWLDMTIDGADEFDPDLNLIKGGGGAHLQEKIVATASDRMVVITDASKQVQTLGKFPLPLEIIPFGWQASKVLVEELLAGIGYPDAMARLRLNAGQPFITDEGNHIIDLSLDKIEDPHKLAVVLNQIPGVVENGLFLDICDSVVIGHQDGSAEVIMQGDSDRDRTTGSENMFRDQSDIAEN